MYDATTEKQTRGILYKQLTLSDHSLQPDDVGVVELPHD